jgi:hypothetical protein
MGLRLTIIAAATIVLPAAAGAQDTAQDQQSAQQPAAEAATQPGDAAQATAKAQTDTSAKAGGASASTKAEVKAGASVYDSKGKLVGKIDSVDGKSAVLNTGKVQVKVPMSSIARDEKGLAIGMSKAEIEAAASKK